MSDENQTNDQVENHPASQPAKAGWTSVQVYTLSIVCLLIGIALGFLYRGSAAHSTPATAAVSQSQTPDAPQMGGQAAGPGGMPAGQPTPDQMKQMAEKKVAPLLEALKTNPNDTDTLAKVGGFYMAAGQFDDAANYYEKITVIKPSAEAWISFSNAQAYGGKGEPAIASLNKALELDPKSANALYNLGILKWKVQGDTKGAVACWEKLVKTNPNHPKLDQVKKLIAHVQQESKNPRGGGAQ